MSASASATPSTAATCPTTEASSRPRWVRSGPRSPAAFSWSALRTTTSVWLLAAAKRSAKLARRVSERASVPARKATPRNTASTVPARRRLLARSRRGGRRSTSAAQAPEAGGDGAGGRRPRGAARGAVGLAPRQQHREGDVLRRREGGHEVVGLEHEADPVAPQPGQLRVGERSELHVADEHVAVGQVVEAGEAVEEGRLARPGGAHDGGEAAFREFHGHVVEGPHGGVTP